MGILVASLVPNRRSVSTRSKKDISLCGDLTNSKSLQLFVCCQGEWVVSSWGRQPAERRNTSLCSFDGCREEYSEVMVERNFPPHPHTSYSYSQYPYNRECFRRQQSHVRIESQGRKKKSGDRRTKKGKEPKNEAGWAASEVGWSCVNPEPQM